MRSRLAVLAVLTVGLLAGCGPDSEGTAPAAASSPAASESAAVAWVGPSGLEVESQDAARAALEAQRVEAERVAAEAAARAAADEAARQTAAAAAAQEAAREAAAAQRAVAEAAEQQAVIEAEGGCPPGWYFDDYLGCTQDAADGDSFGEGDDGYVSSDLEVRCSDGTATVEECFGPGSDLNGNGIADVNE
jgi:membrane protein involved in colicin uptake